MREIKVQRPIKFRAWNQDDQEYAYFVFTENGHYTYTANLVAHSTNAIKDWQMYTGLCDRNGVDIYEGDILGKRPYGYWRADGKTKDGRYKGKEWDCFVVEWGEYDASDAGLVSGYEYETDGKYAGWNIVVGGYDSDLKDNMVIGNIYENPELLEAKS